MNTTATPQTLNPAAQPIRRRPWLRLLAFLSTLDGTVDADPQWLAAPGR